MAQFLDARVSQNATSTNSIAIPIPVINTPTLFAQIGLLTAGAGPNPRVQMKGTITVQLPLALFIVTITIVRGTLATDPFIYSASTTYGLSGIIAPEVITFSANDFNPPITPQLTYSAFISTNLLGTVRVGPENLDGVLVSD
ncbi:MULTISPECIES: hypothetical protein [Paenibacillus]|uniref:Exosporium leader peptide n=1 Tax=Paenibacillus xylanilyticus TaxID=248903 RepID=A0A7Y6EWV9_9BACL|nr:hypothetical protein [Paenibacillus xylanilyticus]NUU76855.1 hypothetical protein [Paenibacillus xylanilyticus]